MLLAVEIETWRRRAFHAPQVGRLCAPSGLGLVALLAAPSEELRPATWSRAGRGVLGRGSESCRGRALARGPVPFAWTHSQRRLET